MGMLAIGSDQGAASSKSMYGSSTVVLLAWFLTFALVSSSLLQSGVVRSALRCRCKGFLSPLAVLTMTSYALGYTIIIIFSKLLAGFANKPSYYWNIRRNTKFGSIALTAWQENCTISITGVGWFMV